MSDLISRETAIQTVHDTMYQFIDDSETMTDRDGLLLKVNKAICNGLKEIPSVENKGEWIAQDIHNCHTNFKCSECGYIHSFMHLYGEPTADYPYCPNCGADMRGDEE
jgi:predicted RNA-binding Zn-ribbon protein involved in translation (DUF1610 family)